MIRERALQVGLVVVGLLFVAGAYPLWLNLTRPGSQELEGMMLSIYIALGVFLLIAVRKPEAHRSLIAFTAWSSLAHAAVMAVQSFQRPEERAELLVAVALFCIIGLAFLVLAPAKQSEARHSAVSA